MPNTQPTQSNPPAGNQPGRGIPLSSSPDNPDAPIVYLHDGIVYVRASSLGSCPLALRHAFHGFPNSPPPADFQEIFAKGHEIEAETVSMLKALGWEIWEQQPRFERFTGLVYGFEDLEYPIHIIGHGDLIGWPPPAPNSNDPIDPVLVEIKGFGPAYMKKLQQNGFMSILGYGLQASFYNHCSSTSNFLTVIYEKETGQLHFHPIPQSAMLSFPDITAPIRAALTPDPPICTLQYPCPYYPFHPETQTNILPTTLITPAKLILELDTKIKALVSAQTLIKDKLKSELQVGAYKAPGFSVSISPNSRRLNMTKVKQLFTDAEVDINDYYDPGSGNRITITITPKKDT